MCGSGGTAARKKGWLRTLILCAIEARLKCGSRRIGKSAEAGAVRSDGAEWRPGFEVGCGFDGVGAIGIASDGHLRGAVAEASDGIEFRRIEGGRATESQGQANMAGSAVIAVDSDVVSGPGNGVELDDTAIGDATGIIVAGDQRQARNRIAGVNTEDGIKCTARSCDGDLAGGWRGPTPPDRFAARIACVVWFARFFGHTDVAAGNSDRVADQRNGRDEIVAAEFKERADRFVIVHREKERIRAAAGVTGPVDEGIAGGRRRRKGHL